MEKHYLLLYKYDGHTDYAWFECEQDLRDFAEDYEFIEAWHIPQANEIIL